MRMSSRSRVSSLLRPSLWWATPLLVGMLLGISCGNDEDCLPGSEGCPCSDGVCLEGLTCLSSYCVDPDWTAPGGDATDGVGADGTASEGGSADNVTACEALIEELECGEFDLTSVLDCSLYADYPCDIADYFDCIREAFECTDGVPDTNGLLECNDLASCE